jgi:hypothetical protein
MPRSPPLPPVLPRTAVSVNQPAGRQVIGRCGQAVQACTGLRGRDAPEHLQRAFGNRLVLGKHRQVEVALAVVGRQFAHAHGDGAQRAGIVREGATEFLQIAAAEEFQGVRPGLGRSGTIAPIIARASGRRPLRSSPGIEFERLDSTAHDIGPNRRCAQT